MAGVPSVPSEQVVASEATQGPAPAQSPAWASAVVVMSEDERDQLRKQFRGVVFDPDEIGRIQGRVDYGQLPWRQRRRTKAPEGWR
jgi:hypothetical protein